MSPMTPEPLLGQARTLAEAAAAVARWFSRPDPAYLSAAVTARLRAAGWRETSVAALKGGRGAARADAQDLSFSLRESVEAAVSAACDAQLWGVGADAEFAAMAEALRDAAKALVRGIQNPGGARAQALIEAKRWASDVERLRRDVRAQAHDSPRFVDAVKRAEIASRLSGAADGLQQACDSLAGTLAS